MFIQRLMRNRVRFALAYGVFFFTVYSFLEMRHQLWSSMESTYHSYSRLIEEFRFIPAASDIQKSDPEEETMQYCLPWTVRNENDSSICGKPFSNDWIPYLEDWNLTDSQVAQMSPEDDERILRKEPVFATALSDNHFDVAHGIMLKTFTEANPSKKIIVYDLGLSTEHVDKLRKLPQIQAIRRFNFSAYPAYVKNLYEYRWKPLVLAELLNDFGAVFYADAHILWQKDDLNGLLSKIRCPLTSPNGTDCHYDSGNLLLCHTEHSIFATTDKRLYEYLPVNISQTKKVEMGCAMFQVLYATSSAKRDIYKWSVLCALEKDCMAPTNAQLQCKFGNDRYVDSANCHSYDQSVTNILLANRNRYDASKYLVNFNHKRT